MRAPIPRACAHRSLVGARTDEVFARRPTRSEVAKLGSASPARPPSVSKSATRGRARSVAEAEPEGARRARAHDRIGEPLERQAAGGPALFPPHNHHQNGEDPEGGAAHPGTVVTRTVARRETKFVFQLGFAARRRPPLQAPPAPRLRQPDVLRPNIHKEVPGGDGPQKSVGGAKRCSDGGKMG